MANIKPVIYNNNCFCTSSSVRASIFNYEVYIDGSFCMSHLLSVVCVWFVCGVCVCVWCMWGAFGVRVVRIWYGVCGYLCGCGWCAFRRCMLCAFSVCVACMFFKFYFSIKKLIRKYKYIYNQTKEVIEIKLALLESLSLMTKHI